MDLEDKFILEFDSVAEAKNITGINKSCIAKVCRGLRKTAGDYKWRYVLTNINKGSHLDCLFKLFMN